MATNKGDELSLMCEELAPELLIVSEHGFNNSNVENFKIQNYKLANSYCRNSFKGGGVAIFLDQKLSFTPLNIGEPTDKDYELTGVKVQTNKSQILAIGLYRSPSGNEESFFSKFEKTLSDLTKRNQNFIVMGDFNIDVLDVDNTTTKRLADLLMSFNLHWSVNSPIRVTAN